MKKKYCIIANVILLLWFFLDMIGVYYSNGYLVTRSYKEDWIFMVIPLAAFILFLYKEKIGKIILSIWLTLWLVTQLLCHEWYTIFGSGIMGSNAGKIEFFKGSLKFINSADVYYTDVYHVILHILILIALITTIMYKTKKKND